MYLIYRTLFKPNHILSMNDVWCISLHPSNIIIAAPEIGFDPASYNYDEDARVARLTITTNMPLRFTDATGALFYTEDGIATGGGGILLVVNLSFCVMQIIIIIIVAALGPLDQN